MHISPSPWGRRGGRWGCLQVLDRARQDTNYDQVNIETNLASFIIKRPDLFGTVEEEIEHQVLRGNMFLVVGEKFGFLISDFCSVVVG